MSQVMMTVTGPDQPGITASLMAILAQSSAPLLDIEQVVVRGQLTLCFLVELDQNAAQGEQVLKDLLFTARKHGQDLSYRVLATEPTSTPPSLVSRYAVTVMGDPIDARAMHKLASVLASHRTNIDSMRRLSHNALSSLEIALTLPDQEGAAGKLKEQLMLEMAECGVDIALQKESLTRRSKRLVALDMDSTLIQVEVIDELARMHGVHAEVSAITHQAMQGEMDFQESLRRRVQLLKGLSVDRLMEMAKRLPLNSGATELIQVLKGLGYRVGIISGGFDFAAGIFKEKLDLDFAYSNKLEIKAGALTGRVQGPIIDAQKKADLLCEVAEQEGIPLEQTVAIGDGANDALMLAKAGLGIAFYGKPQLRRAADTTVSSGGLERILYLLGMTEKDVQEFLGSAE